MDENTALRFASAVSDAAAMRAAVVETPTVGITRVVLVEGDSDRAAVETFADTLERKLRDDGVVVVSMNGATNLPRYLRLVGPAGLGLAVAGLVDVQEAPLYHRSLQEAGLADAGSPLQASGFFACVDDLEDELIRALGVETAIGIVDQVGDGNSFDRMRRQPAQRERAAVDQLHRFVGTAAGRKAVLARAFAAAIPAERIPAPFRQLLDFIA